MAEEQMQSRYTGLDLYQARKKILQNFPNLEEAQIEICYEESDHPRFTVLAWKYDDEQQRFTLNVSSHNPIRHLPSNYQHNDFLRGFLMIFQHIMNETSSTIDNMYKYFRPMESPLQFLPVLADWLGIHFDTLGGEDEVRQFLQYAIPLYRYRGTALGLKAHLSIITKIVPEIIEDANPYEAMVFKEKMEVNANIFETDTDDHCFTIYFPVERNHFNDTLLRRISLAVQQEKPLYTKAYIAFKQAEEQTRKVTVMEKETSMNSDGVIFI
jgi:phage tail-like protein